MNWDFIAGYVSANLVNAAIYYYKNRKKVPKLLDKDIPPLLPLVNPKEQWSMDCSTTVERDSPWEVTEHSLVTVTIEDVKEGYVRYYHGTGVAGFHVKTLQEFTKYWHKTKDAPSATPTA